MDYYYVGASQKPEGPVAETELQSLHQKGVIQDSTLVAAVGASEWVEFRTLAVKGVSLPPAQVTAPIPAVAGADKASDEAQLAVVRQGSSWFYWVAGLSIVNSCIAAFGNGTRFIIGLGITGVIDALTAEAGGMGKSLALVAGLVIAGICALFGFLAGKPLTWAFVVGMILYALDGFIFVLAGDWLGVGFHVFVLFCLFKGFSAAREYNARRAP